MKFPKIYHVLKEGGHKKHNFEHAVIRNGRIQAINRHSGIFLLASNYIAENQLKHVENKVFDYELLKLMHEADEVEFREKDLMLKNGDASSADGLSTITVEYSGVLSAKNEILKFDDLFEDYEEPTGIFFDSFDSILKGILTDGQVDVAKIQKRNTYFRGIMLSAVAFSEIVECLIWKDEAKASEGHVNIEFLHGDPSKDKVEKPSAPLIITPAGGTNPLYDDIVFLMPSFPLSSNKQTN